MLIFQVQRCEPYIGLKSCCCTYSDELKYCTDNPPLVICSHAFFFSTCSWCYKTFFGGNLDFPKSKKLNKVLMSEPAQKCENYEAIFKQNYTPELIIALKMVYSCFFGSRGNLDFPNFLQKSFITSTPALHYQEGIVW